MLHFRYVLASVYPIGSTVGWVLLQTPLDSVHQALPRPSLLEYLLNCFQLHCFPWGCSLSRYCSHELLDYLRLLWGQDLIHAWDLRIIFSHCSQGPCVPAAVKHVPCSPNPQARSPKPPCVPSSCLWSGQVATPPWRPVGTCLCPWTTKLLTLSWKLLPALS